MSEHQFSCTALSAGQLPREIHTKEMLPINGEVRRITEQPRPIGYPSTAFLPDL